jgi:hypothetical protein
MEQKDVVDYAVIDADAYEEAEILSVNTDGLTIVNNTTFRGVLKIVFNREPPYRKVEIIGVHGERDYEDQGFHLFVRERSH